MTRGAEVAITQLRGDMQTIRAELGGSIDALSAQLDAWECESREWRTTQSAALANHAHNGRYALAIHDHEALRAGVDAVKRRDLLIPLTAVLTALMSGLVIVILSALGVGDWLALLLKLGGG